ncbi:hypothetical protein ERJ75_001254800 [Trypanosoma vivax]|nr:hypothetical protein ERJ75_001254800 [Trypanosoma vivax]
MFKRGREEDEVVEVYAALLRQSGARAVERIRQRQSNNTGRLMPIDALVIRYAMWFLDTRAFPVVSYVSQAQRIVTEAIERVSFPQHFSFVPLSMLVECLVAENTAEVMQQTISSIEEFMMPEMHWGAGLTRSRGHPVLTIMSGTILTGLWRTKRKRLLGQSCGACRHFVA